MLYGDGIHDDTAALQEMLDGQGIVTVDRPGTYLISKTLMIHSNTRFILSPGAVLLAAPMSKCALIENEHFAGNGRDENITVTGGTWDGNCDAMGLDAEYEAIHRLDDPYSPSLFKGKLIRFAHLDRIKLTDMVVKNPVSYGIQIGDVRGFVCRDLFFDCNHHFGTTDGVHINGPARDGVIENLCGTTNDDMVSLTTYDEPHAEVSVGPISNVYIHNITAMNGYSGIRLLSGENCEMRSVHIDGLYGDYRHNGVILSNHNKRPGRVWFDDITIEHVHASKSDTPLGDGCFRYWEKYADPCAIIEFGPEAICGTVTLRDIIRRETHTTQGALVAVSSTASIERLVTDNLHQSVSDGVSAPVWNVKGVIRQHLEHNTIH